MEQQTAKENILKLLDKGVTVFTILRHVSKSGMSRNISLVVIDPEGKGIYDITWLASQVLEMKRADDGGITIRGCGMDMGFELVYRLGSEIYDDGYALKQEWL